MHELIRLLREFNEHSDTDLSDLIALAEAFVADNGATEASDDDLEVLITGLTALGADDDTSAALLGEAADVATAARGEVTRREEEAATEEADREAAAARLRGEDPEAGRGDEDEGDQPDDDEESDDGDEPAAEGDDEPAAEDQEPEPVTAAAAPNRATRRALRRRTPRSAQPQETDNGIQITFAADVPGHPVGANASGLDDVNRALFRRAKAFARSRSTGREERLPVATIRREFPSERQLIDQAGRLLASHEATSRVEAVLASAIANYRANGPAALTAAGGLCAPLMPIYTVDVLGEQGRPIRDTALPSFQATRGGVISVAPPTLAQVAAQDPNSVSVWTMADDEAAADNTGDPETDTVKSCARIECGDPRETEVQAIVKCLIIGNVIARTFQEQVDAWSELTMVHHDRFAELILFNQILAAGITNNVSPATNTVSATRDLLNHLARVAWNIRTRHRLGRTFPFRVILPEITYGVMQNDFANALPGGSFVENLAVAEATLNNFFSSRGLNVTWSPDLVVQDPLTDATAVPDWPGSVPYALYPEGTFLLLDSGELDLGVVRDSTLNRTNDFETFAESWEAVHPMGVEAVAGTVEVCPSGAVQGVLDPADFACPVS